MYYRQPTTSEEIYEGDHMEGLYIYPDWASCVEGLWEHHMLVEGKTKRFSAHLIIVIVRVPL